MSYLACHYIDNSLGFFWLPLFIPGGSNLFEIVYILVFATYMRLIIYYLLVIY